MKTFLSLSKKEEKVLKKSKPVTSVAFSENYQLKYKTFQPSPSCLIITYTKTNKIKIENVSNEDLANSNSDKIFMELMNLQHILNMMCINEV